VYSSKVDVDSLSNKNTKITMRMRHLPLMLFFTLLTAVMVSCCPCEKSTFFKYTNKDIILNNLDNSGKISIVAPADSVVKTAFGIQINVKREKIASIKCPTNAQKNIVYSTSCDCLPLFQFLPKDSIINVKIFTSNQFNTTHPMGSDITEYFKSIDEFKYSGIDKFIKTLNQTITDDSELESLTNLFLMTPPEKKGRFVFRLQLTLLDNSTLEFSTKEILLF
jgi:Domain of unknown function (DUF5034)